MDPMHELVITGVGAIGPFGTSSDSLWDAVRASNSAVSHDAEADYTEERVKGFDVSDHFKSRRADRAPLITQFAITAVSEAIKGADLPLKSINKDRVSIVYGTGNGPEDIIDRNLSLIYDSGLGAVEPLGFQESVFNAPASLISIEYGFRGPLLALPMGWAAGGNALCAAADLVASGMADMSIAVASDICGDLCRGVYKKLQFISPNDGKTAGIRPFDIRANGSFLSEGGAAIVIETKEAALARSANILAELKGWANTNDAMGIVPRRGNSKGISNAMFGADPTGLGSDAILMGSYCTKDAETAEAKAVHRYAADRNLPTVTNIRGAVGEAKGVTGLWNVITAVNILQIGNVPYPIGGNVPLFVETRLSGAA